MDVLIVEPLDAEVLKWLGARHAVRAAPALAQDPLAFRSALARVRAVIIPPSVTIDAATLHKAPRLRVVGRLSVGSENIDIDACARARVEVVRPAAASAVAEAEFAIGALLQMLRRIPILNGEGLLVGRELGGCTVGVVGMTPAVKPLAQILAAFGATLIGYDPAVHASDPSWERAGVEPVGLRDLMRRSDAVCVLLPFFARYVGLFGERLLSESKPDQILVSLAHSSLFNEAALARALTEGPLAAAWFDSLEPGLLDPGRALRHVDTLQVTPRVSGTTAQSRQRAAWAVARRIDELLDDAADTVPRGFDSRWTQLPAALEADDDEDELSAAKPALQAGSAGGPERI
ncbi:MAG: phosphoglycerate dehydrogenase [Burkholderiales bacterium]|nr:phosphoglycerate dehydrogenase [Burkholderiales bacterium]